MSRILTLDKTEVGHDDIAHIVAAARPATAFQPQYNRRGYADAGISCKPKPLGLLFTVPTILTLGGENYMATIKEPITKKQFEAANKRGALVLEQGPVAQSARYDSKRGRIVLELGNGCEFAFPGQPRSRTGRGFPCEAGQN